MTILARNPVHSVLWLILTFFNAAGLMLLVGAEFIAMLLVIIYVGAVAVLFLFVVMMLDINFAVLRAGFVRNFPLGIALAVALLVELVLGLGAYRVGALKLGVADGSARPSEGTGNVEAIGALLFGRYPLQVEASGIILLVAMIGAIVLTHRRRSHIRRQDVVQQVQRRPQDAIVKTRPDVGKGLDL